MTRNPKPPHRKTHNTYLSSLPRQWRRIIKRLLTFRKNQHGITAQTVIALLEDLRGGLGSCIDDEVCAVQRLDERDGGVAGVDGDCFVA